MDKLSIVVPCYNESEAIPFFYDEIMKVANKMQDKVLFEYIFVNDGSKDNTLEIIKELSTNDSNVHYISFSRNFGKEAAMIAGLEFTTGDFIAIMDVDLQDPPYLIEEMYNTLKTQPFDCVGSRRVTRKGEPKIRSFFARCFYKIINRISETEIVDGARDFRLMTKQMRDAIIEVEEVNRFSKGIFSWVGFDTKWIEYENVERVAGETKWSFWKLLRYSFDGIIAFSTAPLSIASFLGIVLFIISILMIIFIVIRTLIFGDPVSGWPSLICIILLIGGLQLFCLGIIGQYLAKTYLETKKRPLYIVKESK